MVKKNNNITDKVVDLSLCCGCGICVPACYHQILSMVENESGELIAQVNPHQKCTNCGICLKICPIYNGDKFRKDAVGFLKGQEVLTGKPVAVYAAHATDNETRKECASGGVVTALLQYLLASKHVDGCLLVKRLDGNPLYSVCFIATTLEEVYRGRGSKYSPVDFSCVGDLIKEQAALGHKLAVVGLPCHIAGLKALSEINPEIDQVVKYTLSLVCGQCTSIKAYDYILKKIGFSRDQILSISNRGSGWPGYFQIGTINGCKWKHPHGGQLSTGMVLGSPLFTSSGCFFCADPSGYRADISVSDAWLPRYQTPDNPGENLILIRVRIIDAIVHEMAEKKLLQIEQVSLADFINANEKVFRTKTRNRDFGLPILQGRSTAMVRSFESSHGPFKLNIMQKILLWFYFRNIKIIMRYRSSIPVNRFTLFYGKTLNYIKNL